MGESAVDVAVDAADRFQYVLVILEDVSRYTWLRPSRAWTATGAVEEFVRWCATFGPQTTWVSDNAAHSRNGGVRKLAEALGVGHLFPVTKSASTNGTVEGIVREVIHGATILLTEWRRPLSEWALVLPVVQWALNTAWRKGPQTTPYHVMMSRGRHLLLPSRGKPSVFSLAESSKPGCDSWWFLWWTPRRSCWQGYCNASTPIVVTTDPAAVAARRCCISR